VYLLSLLILADDVFEFVCQVGVLRTQLVVAVTVLLDLSLDVCQRALEVSGDLSALLLILTTTRKGLLLREREGERERERHSDFSQPPTQPSHKDAGVRFVKCQFPDSAY
jgi:hypothetical protein